MQKMSDISEPLVDVAMADLLKKLCRLARKLHLTKMCDVRGSVLEKYNAIVCAFREQLNRVRSLISALAMDIRGDWRSDVDARVENIVSLAKNYRAVEKIVCPDIRDNTLAHVVSFLKEKINRDPDYTRDGRFIRDMPLYGFYILDPSNLHETIGDDLYETYGSLFLMDVY